MDLIVSVLLSIFLVIGNGAKKEHYKGVIYNQMDNTVTETVVEQAQLKVGKNLALIREERAYHKIIDELGVH